MQEIRSNPYSGCGLQGEILLHLRLSAWRAVRLLTILRVEGFDRSAFETMIATPSPFDRPRKPDYRSIGQAHYASPPRCSLRMNPQ
jgi:hypothetical protein